VTPTLDKAKSDGITLTNIINTHQYVLMLNDTKMSVADHSYSATMTMQAAMQRL
jgi:hypothetical protein